MREAADEETEDEVEKVVVHHRRVVVHLAHDLTQRIAHHRRTTTITVTQTAISEAQTMETVMVVPEESETTTLAVTKMVKMV